MGRRRISAVGWVPDTHAIPPVHQALRRRLIIQKQNKELLDYRSTAICYLLELRPCSGMKLLTTRLMLPLLKLAVSFGTYQRLPPRQK
jgi:hypothetical protein